jgi:hypothetical protein
MTECQRLPAVIETAPKNPPQETSDSFDGCIVMPEQLETTVCWNSAGGLVIRLAARRSLDNRREEGRRLHRQAYRH